MFSPKAALLTARCSPTNGLHPQRRRSPSACRRDDPFRRAHAGGSLFRRRRAAPDVSLRFNDLDDLEPVPLDTDYSSALDDCLFARLMPTEAANCEW
jgi:hypothetical protein